MMDREEAIKVINKYFPSTSCGEYKELIEALKMAIEALSSEPTDLISKEDAIAIAYRQCDGFMTIEQGELLEGFEEEIKAFQSADIPTKLVAKINIDADEVVRKIKDEYEIAGRPSGEWVHNNKSGTFKVFTCSECGLNVESDMWCYCPNCGVKMGGNK